MELSITDNGNTVKDKEEALKFGKMDPITKDIGPIIKPTEKDV